MSYKFLKKDKDVKKNRVIQPWENNKKAAGSDNHIDKTLAGYQIYPFPPRNPVGFKGAQTSLIILHH